ncbi:hypothetical protein IP84_12990 [beta proteobacterium AAP99]|nr:hypothetical protein IP84_12990 [beta proteobacterium AAP99]
MKLRAIASLLALSAIAAASHAGPVKVDEDTVYKPSRKGFGEVDHEATEAAKQFRKNSPFAAPSKTAVTNGIVYHGGPVMTAATTSVYYIWYGNWSGNSGVQILTDLASSLGGSPWFNINTTYYSGSTTKTYVKNSVSYISSINNNYSYGKNLTDANIASVVSDAINAGQLPNNANAVYFVLTAPDVTATSGFCTQYCGWHNNQTVGGTNIKYAFIGNPATQCPSSCGVNSPSPNGNGGADAMASILSHELAESVTDPDGNAWYDRQGNENADKCAWTFGTTYTAASGGSANMKLGTRDFLIQQNWLNASGGKCVKAY